MPELPEIYHLAEQMDKELKGRRFTEIHVLQEKCLNMPVAEFTELVEGKRIEQVTSEGKWIFMRLEQRLLLLLNLGMGGNVLLHEQGAVLPKKYQILFLFDDARQLTISFWWFGYLHVVQESRLAEHKMAGKLGPTPVRDPGFTYHHFLEIFQGRKGSVKNLLTNQENIAGIGNVYIQDILFMAGLHPNRKWQSLNEGERSKLYQSLMDYLEEAVKLGGLAYEKDLFDQPGGFKEFLVGYKEGKPCPVCGTMIEKVKTGSTSSYICPACQREKG